MLEVPRQAIAAMSKSCEYHFCPKQERTSNHTVRMFVAFYSNWIACWTDVVPDDPDFRIMPYTHQCILYIIKHNRFVNISSFTWFNACQHDIHGSNSDPGIHPHERTRDWDWDVRGFCFARWCEVNFKKLREAGSCWTYCINFLFLSKPIPRISKT